MLSINNLLSENENSILYQGSKKIKWIEIRKSKNFISNILYY